MQLASQSFCSTALQSRWFVFKQGFPSNVVSPLVPCKTNKKWPSEKGRAHVFFLRQFVTGPLGLRHVPGALGSLHLRLAPLHASQGAVGPVRHASAWLCAIDSFPVGDNDSCIC